MKYNKQPISIDDQISFIWNIIEALQEHEWQRREEANCPLFQYSTTQMSSKLARNINNRAQYMCSSCKTLELTFFIGTKDKWANEGEMDNQ